MADFYNPDYYSFDQLAADYPADSSSYQYDNPIDSYWMGDSGFSDPSSWSADIPDWLNDFNFSPYQWSSNDLGLQGLRIDDQPYANFYDSVDPEQFLQSLDSRVALGEVSALEADALRDQAMGNLDQDQISEEELAYGTRLADQFLRPQAMSYDPRTPMRTSMLEASHPVNFPSQSYLDREGNPVGLLSDGAEFQNPYEYRTSGYNDSLGDTFIQDVRNGLTPGFLSEDLRPTLYSEIRDQNRASGAEEGWLSKAAKAVQSLAAQRSGSQSGTRSGGSGGQQGTTSNPTVASGALNALSAALAAYGAMKGKAGVDRSQLERDSNVQDLGPRYGGTRPIRTMYAKGGGIPESIPGGLSSLALKIAQGLIEGTAGGQDDVVGIDAAPGEYVMDADVVAALGDGNNKAGAQKLDQMRERIRKHKRSGSTKSIPPKAKSIDQYLKG